MSENNEDVKGREKARSSQSRETGEPTLGDRILHATTTAMALLDKVLTVGLHLKAGSAILGALSSKKKFRFVRAVAQAIKWKGLIWAIPKIGDWVAKEVDPVPEPLRKAERHAAARSSRVTREIADSVEDVRSVFSRRGDPALVDAFYRSGGFEPGVGDWLADVASGHANVADEVGDLTDDKQKAQDEFAAAVDLLIDDSDLVDRFKHVDDDPLISELLGMLPPEDKQALARPCVASSEALFGFVWRMSHLHRSAAEVSADIAVTAQRLDLFWHVAETTCHQALVRMRTPDFATHASMLMSFLPILTRVQAVALMSQLAEIFPRDPIRVRPGLSSLLDTLGYTSYSQLERISAADAIPATMAAIVTKRAHISAFIRSIADPSNVIASWLTARRRLAEVIYEKYSNEGFVQEPNHKNAVDFLEGRERRPGQPRSHS